MSNRIQPTHFIEVWSHEYGTEMDEEPLHYFKLNSMLKNTKHRTFSTVALFLIRPKTPQEQANSIYYPLNEQK